MRNKNQLQLNLPAIEMTLRRTRAIDDKSRVVRLGWYSKDGQTAYVFVCHSGGRWKLRGKPIPIADLHPVIDERNPLSELDEAVSPTETIQKHIPAYKPLGRRYSKVKR